MNDLAQEVAQSVQVLLVPWQGGHLMVPNAAVVEILRRVEVAPSNGETDWISGTFNWRNQSLPLVLFEHLLDVETATNLKTNRMRILVCHTYLDDEKQAFVGIQVHGIPRLINLSEEEFEVLDTYPGGGVVLSKVEIDEVSAYIPDLEELGRLLESV